MNFGDVVLVELPRPAGQSGREQFGLRPGRLHHKLFTDQYFQQVVVVPGRG